LLARLGFHTDGFAQRYLFIDGEWRDHIQTSLINDAFRPEWLPSR
jgi:ribosomal-protein-alanine N-acetyltransferase